MGHWWDWAWVGIPFGVRRDDRDGKGAGMWIHCMAVSTCITVSFCERRTAAECVLIRTLGGNLFSHGLSGFIMCSWFVLIWVITSPYVPWSPLLWFPIIIIIIQNRRLFPISSSSNSSSNVAAFSLVDSEAEGCPAKCHDGEFSCHAPPPEEAEIHSLGSHHLWCVEYGRIMLNPW